MKILSRTIKNKNTKEYNNLMMTFNLNHNLYRLKNQKFRMNKVFYFKFI